MPELPEVENVVRSIIYYAKGKTINEVSIFWAKLVRNISIDDFKKNLVNKRIDNIWRKGKYIIFDIGDLVLVCHLRMEGKWFFLKDGKDSEYKHCTALFKLSDNVNAYFVDTRKFGTFDLVKKTEFDQLISVSKLGPDANDASIDIDAIFKKISKARRPIKTILLDQTILAGIGNIYADEILFKSNIHPLVKGDSLSENDVAIIIKNSKIVLDDSIAQGGSTVKSFEISHGNFGNYARFLNVYQRNNLNCNVCGNKIERIVVGGRGTHFCPSCQQY